MVTRTGKLPGLRHVHIVLCQTHESHLLFHREERRLGLKAQTSLLRSDHRVDQRRWPSCAQ